MIDRALVVELRRLALQAGAAIMKIYREGGAEAVRKPDDSPVTRADLAADAILVEGLRAAFPDIPAISEERPETHGATGTVFLVDPLDGTKGFLARDDAFTVNVALVAQGRPRAGVVFAPALGRLFLTAPEGGAVEEAGARDPESGGALRRLAPRVDPARGLRALASRAHPDAQTGAYLAQCGAVEARPVGSSLKFCLIAAGEADFYPRLGPTMQWDTAAADAVLRAAGGMTWRLPDLTPLRYDGPERRNPGFAACGAGAKPPAPTPPSA